MKRALVALAWTVLCACQDEPDKKEPEKAPEKKEPEKKEPAKKP